MGGPRHREAEDRTVHVDVAELDPGTGYRYRFQALGEHSPEGRTRTLPRGPDRLLPLP